MRDYETFAAAEEKKPALVGSVIPPPPSPRSSSSFVDYLAAQGKSAHTVKQTKNYAIRYGYILDTADASPLAVLTPCNRRHAMTALAALSKFQGRYQEFLEMRQRYALKWTSGNNSLQALQRFFNPELSLDTMLEWVRKAISALPSAMGTIIKFNCLTGLRPAESIESVRLLTLRYTERLYYNPERQCLEHFRFPEMFLRQTKKAYISFVTREMLPFGIPKGKVPSHNAIRLACRRRGINMHMHLCRKVFASWLRKEGIQPEIIDLLQGRVSQSVLTRHYLVPQSSFKSEVLRALEKLQSQLVH